MGYVDKMDICAKKQTNLHYLGTLVGDVKLITDPRFYKIDIYGYDDKPGYFVEAMGNAASIYARQQGGYYVSSSRCDVLSADQLKQLITIHRDRYLLDEIFGQDNL